MIKKNLPSGPEMPVRVAQVGDTASEDDTEGESETYLQMVRDSIAEALKQ